MVTSTRGRVLGVLWTAGAVSVGCNVLAAEPTLIGRAVAAWPPIALLLVIEVLARTPLPAGRVRWVAGLGAAVVAVTAALASFHHMHEVALAAGESQIVAWLFPLTVDGLAVVASVALLDPGADRSPDSDRLETVQDRPAEFEQPSGVAFPPVLNGTGSHKEQTSDY